MKDHIKYGFYQWIFPFHLVERGSKIVIFGMGHMGQSYMFQIADLGYFKEILCVDNNHCEIYGAKSPELIMEFGADAVIIAIENKHRAEQVKEQLRDLGYCSTVIWSPGGKWFVSDCEKVRQKAVTLSEMEAEKEYSRIVINSWKKLKSLLRIGRVKDIELTRIGSEKDGGYIMLNDLQGGVAYSFGIGGNVEWDKKMAQLDYQIFMYDHTISALPESNEAFHWKQIGIADSEYHNENTCTIAEILRDNGHQDRRHMILKMDVENAEWGFFDMTDSAVLDQFDQIVIEMHGFMRDKGMGTALRIPYIEKINKTHQAVHVHANNITDVVYIDNEPYVGTLEVTFANRKTYQIEDAGDVSLPLELDIPCELQMPEIRLGNWNRI